LIETTTRSKSWQKEKQKEKQREQSQEKQPEEQQSDQLAKEKLLAEEKLQKDRERSQLLQ
jgi:hypothetical protein